MNLFQNVDVSKPFLGRDSYGSILVIDHLPLSNHFWEASTVIVYQ